MTKREVKVRSGTFADLRGILSDKVKPLSDEELRQWIDEARSRAFEGDPIKRVRRGTHAVDDKADNQD